MQRRLGLMAVCLIAAGLTNPGAAQTTPAVTQDPQWDVPSATSPDGFLPKLGAIKVDGDIAEWDAAAAVPLRFASYIAHLKPSHKWNGPADCGMEALCGWNEEGLCLAGFIADDDVQNDRPPEVSYEQDCLELYMDGRAGAAFMKPPYTKGAYQIFVRPPVGGKGAELAFNQMYGSIEGARLAGKLVAGGWTFELVVPWSAFPGFNVATGACFGLQFGLDDYDARDIGTIQPLMMSWQAATSLFMSPQKMVKWVLVDKFPKSAVTSLGTVAGIDMTAEIFEGNTVKVSLELGRTLAAQAHSGTYEVKDWTGAVAAKGPITLTKLAPPWQDSAAAVFDWTMGNATDGVYAVEAVFADAQGAPLGVLRRHVMLVRFLMQEGRTAVADAIARIEKADIAKLAQTEPYKAAAWLGAAACVEKLKWVTEMRNRKLVPATKRELQARLTVLETGALPKDCDSIFKLLALTARPEAQTVVEYGPAVTFYWGGFPLASASIQEFPDADTARKQFDAESTNNGWWNTPTREDLKLAGLPAHSIRWPSWTVPSGLSRFNPTNQVLVCSFGRNMAVVVDVDDLDMVQADAATTSSSTPGPVRKIVKRWAKKTGKPIVDFQQAATNAWCIVAGMPTDEKDLQKLRQIKRVNKAVPVEYCLISALDGSRIISMQGGRVEVAESVMRLVKAGNPVTVEDADALRQTVLRAVPKPPVTPASVTNMNLYSGDVHVHSLYSDGSSTPVGMALQAMYCGMDFVVLTDHNTIDGAMVAAKLFRTNGIAFSVIVGEEVTMSWAHMNAYPLREPISVILSPYDTIRAAHMQGAVIQWNHPGAFDFDWYVVHGEQTMRGTALDAWEHIPPQYDQWKREGRLPPLVGSTDTHDGTYGSSERTLILAPSPAANDVAEAVRRKAVLLVDSGDPRLFLGPDDMIALARAALTDGPAMRERYAARIKAALEKADIPALLRKSPATIVKPADVAP